MNTFTTIAQLIVDTIPSLGSQNEYICAFVYIFDEENQGFRFLTCSQVPKFQQALQISLSATPLEQRIIPITNTSTLLSKAYTTSTMQHGNCFADVVGTQISPTEELALSNSMGFQSFLVLPLASKGKVEGMLQVAISKPYKELSKNTLQTLEHYIAMASLALSDQPAFFEKAHQQYGESELLASDLLSLQTVIKKINSTLDFNEVAQLIVDLIVQVGSREGVIASVIYTIDEDIQAFRYVATSNIPKLRKAIKTIYRPARMENRIVPVLPSPHPTVLSKVAETRKIQFGKTLRDLVGDQLTELEDRTFRKEMRFESFVVYPILIRGKIKGALQVSMGISQKSVTPRLLAMIQSYVDQASLALENARLYQKKLLYIDQRALDLHKIQMFSQLIASSLNFDDVAQRIVDNLAAVSSTSSEDIVITVMYVFDEKEHQFHFFKTSNNAYDKQLRASYKTAFENRIIAIHGKPSLMQELYRKGTIQIANSLSELLGIGILNVKKTPPLAKLWGVQSYVAIPMKVKEKIIGVLQVSMRTPKENISIATLESLNSFASQAAIAMENARLYNQINQYASSLEQKTKDLEKAYKELQVLDQAKMEFVSIASHQLRTPISALRGYVSMLSEGDYGKLTKAELEAVRKTENNIERLAIIVEDILSIAQIEAGKFIIHPTSCAISPIIVDVIEQLTERAEKKGLALRFLPPSTAIPNLTLDTQKILQALTNLVDNAIHYTSKGSIKVTLTHKQNSVQVTVKDTGIGIVKDYLEKLFTKFSREEQAQRIRPDGTGIGLYLVKNIVEAHGGTILVKSQVGKGTSFTLSFPVNSKNILAK
ncbi:MAG: ATP-binding protein [bacterium]